MVGKYNNRAYYNNNHAFVIKMNYCFISSTLSALIIYDYYNRR